MRPSSKNHKEKRVTTADFQPSSSTMKGKVVTPPSKMKSESPEISEPQIADDIEDEASLPKVFNEAKDEVNLSDNESNGSVSEDQQEGSEKPRETPEVNNNDSVSPDPEPSLSQGMDVEGNEQIVAENQENTIQEFSSEPSPQQQAASGPQTQLKLIQPNLDNTKQPKLNKARVMDIESALNGHPPVLPTEGTVPERKRGPQIMFMKKYVLEQRCLDWIQPYDDVADELRNMSLVLPKIGIDESQYRESKSVHLQTTKVYFPHEPHKGQVMMMENIMGAIEAHQNAIIEMPAGSGKSLALLTCALGWLYSRQEIKKNLDTKIIYVAKNHSSCDQIAALLKQTCYRPRVTVIGNRDLYCQNEDLAKVYGSEKSGRCMKLVRCGDCRYYTGLDGNRKATKNLVFESMAHTVDHLNDLGRQHGFCPYYYSKNVANESHVIIMTHGFLTFYGLRETIKDYLRGAIMIVDDAQSIIQSAEDGEGAKISVRDLNQTTKELQKIISELKSPNNQSNTQYHSVVSTAQQVLQAVSGFKADVESRYQTNHKKDVMLPGKDIFEVVQKVLGSKQPASQFQGLKSLPQDIRSHLEMVSDILELIYNDRELVALSFSSILKWALFLERVLDLLENFLKHEYVMDGWKRQITSHYEFVIENKWFYKTQSLMVDLKCLSAHLCFRDIQNCGPRSIIFSGHTLAPFEGVITETQVPFHKQFFWPAHVVSVEKQFFGSIVTRLGSDLELKFDFNSRGDMRMNERIGELVEKVAKMCEKSVLIYFTNSISLKTCYEAWYQLGLANRIQTCKKIIRENDPQTNFKKEIAILKEANAAFEKVKAGDLQPDSSIEAPKAVMLMATHGGKIAEELEKHPGLVQVVILMGAPYCSTSTAAIAPKKKYMDKMCVLEPDVIVGKGQNATTYKRIQGSQWYDKVYSRSTNIAINTAVQGRYDSAAVLFLDHRFEWKKNKGEMPLWCRKKLKNHYDCDSILSNLRDFFSEAQEFVTKLRETDNSRKDQPWRVPRIAQQKGRKKGAQEIIDFDLDRIDQELDDINEEDLKRLEMGLNKVEPVDHMKMLKQNLKEAKAFTAALKKSKFADPSHSRRGRRPGHGRVQEDDGFVISDERVKAAKGRSVPLAKYYGKGTNRSEDEEESQREDSINQNYSKMRDAIKYEQILKKRGVKAGKERGQDEDNRDTEERPLGKRRHKALVSNHHMWDRSESPDYGLTKDRQHSRGVQSDARLRFRIPDEPLTAAELELLREYKRTKAGGVSGVWGAGTPRHSDNTDRTWRATGRPARKQAVPDGGEESGRSETRENFARRSVPPSSSENRESGSLQLSPEQARRASQIDNELAELRKYIGRG